MGNNVTKIDLRDEWKDISEQAHSRAKKTHDQFNNDLVLIGGTFTALSALLVYVKPDLIGISIATLFPLTGALVAHIRNYKEEHFYKAFATHALDMRDRDVPDDELLKLPRIDHEIISFRQSPDYKAPSTLSCLAHFRTAIIGAAAGTAMTIVGGFSENGYDVFHTFRKEETETSQASDGQEVVVTQPHPSPAPQQN